MVRGLRQSAVTPSSCGRAATKGLAKMRSTLAALRARVYSCAFSNCEHDVGHDNDLLFDLVSLLPTEVIRIGGMLHVWVHGGCGRLAASLPVA